MKSIFEIPSKITVKISTLFTIILSLLLNRYRTLFLQYLLAFIHELFHCIGALFYKLNINSITFLPFGFYADLDNLYYVKWYQELIIILLGPLSFFFSMILIKYLYLNEFISYYLYIEMNKTNLFILLFNLLPIYPLDGYRIFKIIFELFFVEKKSLKIMNFISLISTIIFTIFTFKNNQIFILSFLIYNQIIMFISFKEIYKNFLISKTIDNKNNKVKFHYFLDLYRPYDNLVLKNNRLYSDKTFSFYLLKRRQKK